ncbi:MAG: hypothetical protein F6J95_029660 [Leptolyngbya sp. SIO1E4]|nr:hypothetical protein [Leptolyngbya sp. SIO1E4]
MADPIITGLDVLALRSLNQPLHPDEQVELRLLSIADVLTLALTRSIDASTAGTADS